MISIKDFASMCEIFDEVNGDTTAARDIGDMFDMVRAGRL